MANKWAGVVAYERKVETRPSIFEEEIIEVSYTGDIEQHSSRRDSGNRINADIVVSNVLSIVADPMAMTNFMHIAYVTYMGAKWAVSSAVLDYPRIRITLGGLYNEDAT